MKFSSLSVLATAVLSVTAIPIASHHGASANNKRRSAQNVPSRFDAPPGEPNDPAAAAAQFAAYEADPNNDKRDAQNVPARFDAPPGEPNDPAAAAAQFAAYEADPNNDKRGI